ncbi:MAG: tetratricopeptide repeat protein [Gemmatimonadales bacterium]
MTGKIDFPTPVWAMIVVGAMMLFPGCERGSDSEPAFGSGEASPLEDAASLAGSTAPLPEEPSPPFRNIDTATPYVGDEACGRCHEEAASAYRAHGMARSFHPWTPEARIEASLDEPLLHARTGFYYSVVEAGDTLYQEELLIGPDGERLYELRRRMDYVMGSGNVARTYFTEENGRLFQLPLTWYRVGGWDFSPGYELNNPRFGRLMPDGCIACHSSFPDTLRFLEGKYARVLPGIGCQRCHGPGGLHVSERTAGPPPDSAFDDSILNPKHLSFERRLDLCEQCHVHTPVILLREGQGAFSYLPSQPLRNHAAFFKAAGSIDIVSHADRLRQSACFIGTRRTGRPLECATCHDPHEPVPDLEAMNEPCRICHAAASLERRLASSASLEDHGAAADCVSCHMPSVKEHTVPHGTFTDHWIRVVGDVPEPARTSEAGDRPLEPYFERDRIGPEADIYQGMSEIVFATRGGDPRLLRNGAETLGRALGADTTRGAAHFLLGLAYRQLGRTEDAITALERSLRVEPDHPERLHALAQAYETAGRDPATVAPLYERALELQPALAWIRADYASFLQAQGRREEAEEAYRAALAERPSLDIAAFNLGTLLTEEGSLAEAAEAFRQAVLLDPLLAEALEPLVWIRATGTRVTDLRILGSPLPVVPRRERGPDAVRLTLAARAPEPAVQFVNVPGRASVRIQRPDGTLVRVLPAQGGPTLQWDLLTKEGTPLRSGPYHVQVRGEDASGRPLAPQDFSFGVVRSLRP